MLAYLFDPDEPEFLRERELVRDDRVPRARAMVGKLQDLGVPITWEQVTRIAGDASLGRPHIATALVELGVVATVSDAFTPEWLANGGRAYAEKHELDPFEAIRLVKAAAWGHGVRASAGRQARRGRARLRGRAVRRRGLDGIEVDHVDHDAPTRVRLRGQAAELGLLVTGSSDYHGSRKSVELGACTTDPEIYGEITRRASGAFPVPGAGGRA